MRFVVALVELSALFAVAGAPVSRAVADDANTCMYRIGDERGTGSPCSIF
jgi:hypothetical protein